MPGPQENMKKFTNPQVYMGPVRAAQQPTKNNDGAEAQTATLRTKLAEAEKKAAALAENAATEKKRLVQEKDVVTKELAEVKAKLEKMAKDMEELQKAATPAPDPVNGLRVNEVIQVQSNDGLIRLDCKVKPTTGPLLEEVAIIVPEKELDKIFEQEEEEDNG